MTEQFSNNFSTTLSAAITSTTRPVTFTVASSTGAPAGPTFRVVIDSEILNVTAGGAGLSSWTADTEAGSTAATHANGATVTHILTAAALAQIKTDVSVLVKIAEQVLTGTAATITISSIPGTYTHLLVQWSLRTNQAANVTVCTTRFNSDSGANYDFQQMYAASTAVAATQGTAGTEAGFTIAAGSTAPTNVFDVGEFITFNYAATDRYKVALSRYVRQDAQSINNLYVQQAAGIYRSTSAITALSIAANSGSFIAGSRVTLYGMV